MIIVEDRTMKRQLLMMLILATIALAGMLHGGYRYHEKVGEILASQEYMNHFPDNVIPAPMPITLL
jgi:hypothetical protein